MSGDQLQMHTQGGVCWYSVPLFEKAGGVTAAFSMRKGGVSEGKLSSLNLGFAKPEPRENVQENYRRFLKPLGLDAQKIVITVQKHTDIILKDAHLHAGLGWDIPSEIVADAEMTDQKGCVLVKLTADCVPVLLYAPDVHAIAAIHDGWAGTVKRLAQKTAESMVEQYGADPSKMLAAIGPSIGPCCFEVQQDVADIFLAEFDPANTVRVSDIKWHIDLWKCNVDQLMDAGLVRENIAVGGICTRCSDEDMFFSYRREGVGTGSLAAVISLD